jgi:hypothetical protein
MRIDSQIYFLIAALGFGMSTTFKPDDWHFWAGSALAGLIALKAKRSKGTDNGS